VSKNTIILKQDMQKILNIVEALHFYKDNAVKPKYKIVIEEQLVEIAKQLQIQNVSVYVNDLKPRFKFGDEVVYEGRNAIIVGMSNEDDFVKIALCENNTLKTLDVPIVLLSNIICP
jgi:hypothetical protein